MSPLSGLKLPVVGAQLTLDRAAVQRKSDAWIAECMVNPFTRFMVLFDLKLAVASPPDRSRTDIRWFTLVDIERLALSGCERVFLGLTAAGAAHFCVNASRMDTARLNAIEDVLRPLVDLRSLATQGTMSADDLAIAAQARAIAAWRLGSKCCGRCGASTALKDGGWRAECTACGLEIYPRCDPAVIMLVTDGERCLIGHEVRFPDKFYSVLAGFVEPGDDIETAVRREVMEETSVRVGRVAYVASQPWPFAHTLMIGCWAEALSTELRLDPAELEDARWVDRAQVAAMLEGREPDGFTLPSPQSMAHTLFRAFMEDFQAFS